MPAKPIAHGTWHGYKQERYRKHETCDECREAWRAYCYERKEQRDANNNPGK